MPESKLARVVLMQASRVSTLRINKATQTRNTLSMAEDNSYELASFPNMLSSDRSASNKSDSRVNLTTAANGNHSELNQRKRQSTGKMCAMMLVALIAALAILVLAGIVALILFNPQTTDFNSEIQTLRQQVESLRMTVTQIQLANVSSSEGTAREEISRQVIQEMLDISIQELKLHMNSSIQEIERKVQYGEQKIDNLVKNQTIIKSRIESIKLMTEEMKANVSKKLQKIKLQLDYSSEAISQLGIETLLERVNRSASNILALQQEVQTNNIATQQEITEKQEELHELRAIINTTEIELNEKLAKAAESFTEALNLKLISVESQNNLTRSWLNNQLTNTTVALRKAVYKQLRKVESRVNTTQRIVQQINFELPSVLENATTPLVMNIHHLRDWTNKSLETLKLQYTNVVHDLERRFNQSQIDKNTTGSKFCVQYEARIYHF